MIHATNSEILAAIRERLPQTNRVTQFWAELTSPELCTKENLAQFVRIYAETATDKKVALDLLEQLQ